MIQATRHLSFIWSVCVGSLEAEAWEFNLWDTLAMHECAIVTLPACAKLAAAVLAFGEVLAK